MNNKNSVKFVINTIKREKEVVRMTEKNLDFLKKQKIIFTLPEKDIENEYKIEKYQRYKKWLEEKWKEREGGFVEKLLLFFHEPETFQFIVEISNYGPLGSYNPQNNTVTINLNTPFDPIETIKHEMVHIMVEPFVKKYKISHNQKEIIVKTISKILK